MELLIVLLLLAIGVQVAKAREQRQRIALLGGYLARYQIEKLMENLTEGYLRALDADDAERRAQIWRMLETGEVELSAQLQRLVEDFSRIWGDLALVSTLPVALPLATKLFPRATFDLRQALTIHAEGIAAVVANEAGRSPRDKAHMLTAELFLLQHSCHWFCRSGAVASARLLARHQTNHAQVLAAVSPRTREAYQRLTGVTG